MAIIITHSDAFLQVDTCGF